MDSAKPPDSGQLPLPDNRKAELARTQFLLASLNLALQGIHGSPWLILRDHVFPKWKEILNPKGSGPMRYLDYLERQAGSAHRTAEARSLLDSWATDCWLVERVDHSMLAPAGWIVDEAWRCCEQWDRPRGANYGVEAIPFLADMDAGPLVPPPSTPGVGSSVLIVPMDNPSRGGDESWPAFRRRARNALNLHLRRLALRESASRATPKGARNIKTRAYKLDHFDWLVLYQCCNWSLLQIQREYPYVTTVQAVWMGLSEKALLIGLAIRPKRVKENLPY